MSSSIEILGGVFIDVLNPDPDAIHIEAIAHALAQQVRFAGHCIRPFSIAEHSINVSYVVPPEDALAGLMHDATEAFLVDIPTPIKRLLPRYYEIEENLYQVIATKYGLPGQLPESVKEADARMAITEKVALLDPNNLDRPEWAGLTSRYEAYPDFPIPNHTVSWKFMKQNFIRRFRELTKWDG